MEVPDPVLGVFLTTKMDVTGRKDRPTEARSVLRDELDPGLVEDAVAKLFEARHRSLRLLEIGGVALAGNGGDAHLEGVVPAERKQPLEVLGEPHRVVDDEGRLAQGAPVFDALYTYFKRRKP